MNSRQKEVLQAQLDDEKTVIRKLKVAYGRAMAETEAKIQTFTADIQLKKEALQSVTDASQRALLESEIQSKVYQKQYQEALKGQISAIFDNLQSKQYDTIKEYLDDSYTKGFTGTMYDLHGQGIPLILPIDQTQVVDALTMKTKLSKPLYQRLGVDIDSLKKIVNSEISRGIATGRTWAEIAQIIDRRKNINLYRASRIARTEGHRVQQSAAFDAMKKAKGKGADLVKQWDATLDDRTRPDHALLDGQIREVDEPFEVSGYQAMMPGQFGIASEDIHCRCVALQRARWALDDEELQTLKDRAAYFGLDKSKDFDDFTAKYLKAAEKIAKMEIDDTLLKPIQTTDEHYKKLLDSLEILSKQASCKYNPVLKNKSLLTSEEIIAALAGGDKTKGSCASAALSYVGQRQGWHVLDFRGGESQRFFSSPETLRELSMANGIKTIREKGACSITVGNRLLKHCEAGKEYYLCVGRHAAIVRRTDENVLQFLELQSARNSGWTDFNGNPRYTLKSRFGCSSSSDYGISQLYDFMIDLDESNFDTDEFKSILGYINTAKDEQKKGTNGTIK